MINPDQLFRFAAEVKWTETEAAWRRAVSAAYYGLFHTIAEAGAGLCAAGPELRRRIARSYEHGALARAAESIERPRHARRSSPEDADPRLVLVATALRRLREAREKADYDLAWSLTWDETETLVSLAIDASLWFSQIQAQPATIAFVLEPLLRDRNRRG